jgi:hypothetical protein
MTRLAPLGSQNTASQLPPIASRHANASGPACQPELRCNNTKMISAGNSRAAATLITRMGRDVRSIGFPRKSRLVTRRLPGRVTRANPIKKIGVPSGPGNIPPRTRAEIIRIQPMRFRTSTQKYRAKNHPIRPRAECGLGGKIVWLGIRSTTPSQFYARDRFLSPPTKFLRSLTHRQNRLAGLVANPEDIFQINERAKCLTK